jgi:hypothetical protein
MLKKSKIADPFWTTVEQIYEDARPVDEEMRKFLEGVIGCVEADGYAQHMLWHQYHHKPHFDQPPMTWEQGRSGLCEIVGYVADMPVNVSLYVNVVDGHRILFYDAVSRVVDHEMVREWLDKVLPDSARRPDGYINNTDATNFSNILPRKI